MWRVVAGGKCINRSTRPRNTAPRTYIDLLPTTYYLLSYSLLIITTYSLKMAVSNRSWRLGPVAIFGGNGVLARSVCEKSQWAVSSRIAPKTDRSAAHRPARLKNDVFVTIFLSFKKALSSTRRARLRVVCASRLGAVPILESHGPMLALLKTKSGHSEPSPGELASMCASATQMRTDWPYPFQKSDPLEGPHPLIGSLM